ncbi:hypothetical protein CCP4SC76_6750002 [Gammaproteobacteria bacterium]
MKLDEEVKDYLVRILEEQIAAAESYKEAIDAVAEKYGIPKKPLRTFIKAIQADTQEEAEHHALVLQELIANKGPTQLPLGIPGITNITITSRDGSSTMTAH